MNNPFIFTFTNELSVYVQITIDGAFVQFIQCDMGAVLDNIDELF